MPKLAYNICMRHNEILIFQSIDIASWCYLVSCAGLAVYFYRVHSTRVQPFELKLLRSSFITKNANSSRQLC